MSIVAKRSPISGTAELLFALAMKIQSGKIWMHPEFAQPFYDHFSGTTRVSRCQKRTSGLYGAREDQYRHNDHLAGHHSIWTK